MSALGSILDAVVALCEGAVAGLEVSRQPRAASAIPPEAFPHLVVLGAALTTERLEWGQDERAWTITATLVRKRADEPPDFSTDGVRETLAADIEAIAAAILADPTLGGDAFSTVIRSAEVISSPDEPFGFATLVVSASRFA